MSASRVSVKGYTASTSDNTNSMPQNPNPALVQEDAETALYTELWKKCLGPLVTVPQVNELVFYFPQGHIEQLDESTSKTCDPYMPTYDLPSKILCRVADVLLKVEPDTDEVYAQVHLIPETNQDETAVRNETLLHPQPQFQIHSFTKTLSKSDTSTHGGFSVLKRHADECLPPLDMSSEPPAQELVTKDLDGKEWRFNHVYRGQPKRHLLQSGWSAFISSKKLVAGDAFIFLRGENGEQRVGVRRAKRHQKNAQSSVISSHSIHLGVLATVWHAIQTNTVFSIYYKPRTSQDEFIVPYDQYMESARLDYTLGTRFTMRLEDEDISSEQQLTGTIVGTLDADKKRWPNSKWKCLKVRWDEISATARPERVSPWKIKLGSSAAIPIQVPRLKRSRSRVLSSSPTSSVLTREGQGVRTLGGTESTELDSSEKPLLCNASFTNLLSSFGSPVRDNCSDQADSKRHQLENGEDFNFVSNPSSVMPIDLSLTLMTASFNAPGEGVSTYQNEAGKPQESNFKALFGIPDQSKIDPSDKAKQMKNLSRGCGSTRSRTKVHKQGSALGRSVDLSKFTNYDELFAELDSLFEFNGELKSRSKNWLLVFVDDENDKMLVGDDPWKEFCAMARKILILTKEEAHRVSQEPELLFPSVAEQGLDTEDVNN